MSYIPNPRQMAGIIAAGSLKSVRENPNNHLGDWFDGRACAVALMFQEPELIAAANEIRFLIGNYALRHYA